MRAIDSLVYVFLMVTIFSGIMFAKSVARQRQVIRSQGNTSSPKSHSVRQLGTLSTGLWLMLFLGSGLGTATNYAITYYQHKGFEQHEAEVPVYPGAVPTKIMRMPALNSQDQGSLTVGNYEARATPEIIVNYFRNNALKGGWYHEEDKQNILIILENDDGNQLKIVIQKLPPQDSHPMCSLMYLQSD